MNENSGIKVAIKDPIVKPWDTGTHVVALQEMLRAHGFSIRNDGDFGWITEAAVKEFQRQHGLRIDGIVGPKTWAVLRSNLKVGCRTLHYGHSGADVRELQGLLQVSGYPVPRHGFFCHKTQKAVVAFQERHHLKPTSQVDAVTWTVLRNGASLPQKPKQERWFFDPRRWW